ncbi:MULTISPECIES: CE1759 family FMN reductase [unclassified Solwaraspora]|uniref:CE1759 family FMN reductase n=1 Tax=unclassified Solwaraspora TaxID=2627926 RepID=UPI00259B6141|nr:CE1759 family FMN reductase [Solwaraspora sp. WMMA2056]WJK41422.1 NAD(P)H-dependent oxidoreductase [Solwaraspora sp. WMMA2056]
MPDRRRLAVVTAGVSQPSTSRLLADQLAAAARAELVGLGTEVETTVVEVRDHAHEVVDNTLTGFPAPALKQALDAVAAADGLIAVSPVFNASYSGLFKAFFDVLPEGALTDKPVLIGATGGTARHSLAADHAFRPMFAYLRAVVVPTAVFAAPEDWAGAGEGEGSGPGGALRRRVVRAGQELAREVHRREPAQVADPFALSTDFAQLRANSTST